MNFNWLSTQITLSILDIFIVIWISVIAGALIYLFGFISIEIVDVLAQMRMKTAKMVKIAVAPNPHIPSYADSSLTPQDVKNVEPITFPKAKATSIILTTKPVSNSPIKTASWLSRHSPKKRASIPPRAVRPTESEPEKATFVPTTDEAGDFPEGADDVPVATPKVEAEAPKRRGRIFPPIYNYFVDDQAEPFKSLREACMCMNLQLDKYDYNHVPKAFAKRIRREKIEKIEKKA